jgi:transcriptional regulator with XRE-family HTH domain
MNPRARFGQSLRQQRERRNVSLETIAQNTKISRSLLAALERGDWSRWPTGIYSRAYIRSYADAVGLDSNAIVAEFGECFPETAWPDRPAAPDPVPAATPAPPAALRLSFESDDHQPWRRARERAVIVLTETVGLVACAALLAISGADFWAGLAAVSIGYHAFGSVLLGGSPSGWAVRLRFRGSDPKLSRIVRAVTFRKAGVEATRLSG